jgi:D-alanyl-D-alanine carboxypeptidase
MRRRGCLGFVLALSGAMVCGQSVDATTEPTEPSIVPTLFGAMPTNQVDAATATSLQGVLDQAVESGLPDAIAAIVTSEGTWAGAAGVDGPNGRVATPDDVFAIASISKTFTAALVMRLVEQGKLEFDAPLSDYLGALSVDTNGSTVGQALAMRSGIPDTSGESLERMSAAPEHVWTTPEIVAEIPPPAGPPGEAFVYSNPTYKLLDLAAEHVTGLPLYEAMRSEVLEPAGSPGTLLLQNAENPTPEPWALPLTSDTMDVASYGSGGALPSISDATFALAASGMASDAPSLAAWSWELFAGSIVSAESLNAMMTTDENGYGLGVENLTGGFGTASVFGHGGTKDGYVSLLAVVPDRQTVIVVFVNLNDADPALIAADLLDALDA